MDENDTRKALRTLRLKVKDMALETRMVMMCIRDVADGCLSLTCRINVQRNINEYDQSYAAIYDYFNRSASYCVDFNCDLECSRLGNGRSFLLTDSVLDEGSQSEEEEAGENEELIVDRLHFSASSSESDGESELEHYSVRSDVTLFLLLPVDVVIPLPLPAAAAVSAAVRAVANPGTGPNRKNPDIAIPPKDAAVGSKAEGKVADQKPEASEMGSCNTSPFKADPPKDVVSPDVTLENPNLMFFEKPSPTNISGPPLVENAFFTTQSMQSFNVASGGLIYPRDRFYFLAAFGLPSPFPPSPRSDTERHGHPNYEFRTRSIFSHVVGPASRRESRFMMESSPVIRTSTSDISFDSGFSFSSGFAPPRFPSSLGKYRSRFRLRPCLIQPLRIGEGKPSTVRGSSSAGYPFFLPANTAPPRRPALKNSPRNITLEMSRRLPAVASQSTCKVHEREIEIQVEERVPSAESRPRVRTTSGSQIPKESQGLPRRGYGHEYQLLGKEDFYPSPLNVEEYSEEKSIRDPSHFDGYWLQKRDPAFTPYISVGALSNMHQFFENLKGNLDSLEKLPESDRAALVVKQGPAAEPETRAFRPPATAAYLHAIRNQRPPRRIRNFVENSEPSALRGSNNYDPSYLWSGLGRKR